MDEQALRDRLGAVDVPATRLQVQTVVDAGRRRVFRRRAAQASCGAALATGLLLAMPYGVDGRTPVPSNGFAGDLRCAVAKLPVLAGMTAVTADGVDPTGKYIIGNNLEKVAGSQAPEPILWTDGKPQALPVVGEPIYAAAVNAGGVVAAVAADRHSVFRYVDGVPVKLSPPAGAWLFTPMPRINARGDVLATAHQKRGPAAGEKFGHVGKDVALLWKAGSEVATRLPLPAGARGLDITDDGTIVGDLAKGSDITDVTSYAWDQRGNGRKLKAPAGQIGTVYSAQGTWATGNLWPSGTAARWNLRTGEVTDLHIHAPANAVNGRGWVIADGALQRDGVTVNLESAKGGKGDPRDVSDAGLVVGSMLGYDKEGSTTSTGPLTWRCDR
jgi:hypothetical protein